jgi:hypothetical protein
VRELKNAIQRARLLCRDSIVQGADLGLITRAQRCSHTPGPATCVN